ncbi:phytoene/squalene synthase family protein [Actinophytocola gossypii]|uniref:Phytoene/squalene synthase family protein n=1 Tax=Actinophytocola gossypii TaxID=2812003 RepID=A0ABT2JIP4_9PSEU|nr:phytoene/squalene synthase family protein [Actinophytocola gossypii]MCT2587760.1 phytoene/squalene synthase family protein [Actinophytocola gossypii]
MSDRELDAAGIRDPELRAAYRRCRALNAEHGRTYFLATRLLAADQRPGVHALYGFARYVDNVVDEPDAGSSAAEVRARLDDAERHLRDGLASGRGRHPVIAAVVDTAARYDIDPALFTAFLESMRMDLTVRGYATRAELAVYVHGSARVIGLQMLPVLGTVTDPAEAAPRAAALGEAFQLTNFLRDVAEDLDRDRVYLPADELTAFDVDRERLRWCRERGHADQRVRRALADQVARTRALYREAAPGVAMLRPASRPCIATAFTLYSEILDRIEAMDHDVFARRAVVGNARRAAVAAPAVLRSLLARRRTREVAR